MPERRSAVIHPLSREQIRSTLDRYFKSQLGVCAALEDIADSLPNNFSRNNCLLTAQRIRQIIRKAHIFEEDYLFPLLLDEAGNQPELEPVLARLRAEHCEDESFADEIVDALEELATVGVSNIDKLSYMLRGFFEGLRRHIAFEKEHLLPLLTQKGTPA
uniref:hemerythrin domain-containing protein n=1 Tax=Pararhizobium sp. IMCC3301 TaxID=3067904 RepID=UPI0027424C2D|nr:hemerythrin domain-containing protein [Pararhizobium sp. IMCC3301]